MKHLVDFHVLLKAAIEAELTTTNVVFDAEYFYRKDGQGSITANRVVVAESPEDAGTFLPPVILSRAPPEVGIERQNVAIEVWGYDGSAPTDRAKQFIALKALSQCVWRHTQAIIRANYHVTPRGEVPGFYQIKKKPYPLPTERVHGKRELWTFWIDFSVRDIAPTTLDEPDLDMSVQLE